MFLVKTCFSDQGSLIPKTNYSFQWIKTYSTTSEANSQTNDSYEQFLVIWKHTDQPK